jgi:hypothetical protein
MRVRQLKPFEVNERYPAPINPFHQDFVHVGTYIGKNLAIMEGNKDYGNVGYIIVINLLTGERKMINIFDKYPRQSLWSFFISLFQRDNSTLKEKIVYRIRTEWNYRPWLKWVWTY